jgi:hypothetical protein
MWKSENLYPQDGQPIVVVKSVEGGERSQDIGSQVLGVRDQATESTYFWIYARKQSVLSSPVMVVNTMKG